MQVVSNMLASPLTGSPLPWIAFSFNPEAVRAANNKSLPVFFGDGANPAVLAAVTPKPPRAFVLTHRSHPQLMLALRTVRTQWPTVPAFALTIDVRRAGEVQSLGATAVVTRASAGVALGDAVLRGLMSTSYVDLVFLEQEMQLAVRDAIEASERQLEEERTQGEEADGTAVAMRSGDAGMFILDTSAPPVRPRRCCICFHHMERLALFSPGFAPVAAASACLQRTRHCWIVWSHRWECRRAYELRQAPR